ncbi:hypothetical protein NC797_14125 [Aquibacillus sp. 3ASR75-11]|uniref:Uncharacterized protein n=1 Tax=Terrihalobacillus insolitus TaxID=2950438 RepID=A0A9X3WWU8_9BACI|nr:hypothetical protein [Terrihalobacillus insolitus]MDC3414806.1 hypothetical protein [Terrihalobacillus insolitus]MDC3425641.1 hypothetical protein [Terrihalobacillus insolitus]
MRRKNNLLFLLLLLAIIFVGVPLIISVSYGNVPFYNNNYLSSYNVLVTTDESKNNGETTSSYLTYNTYTWSEIEQYVISNQMTFSHVFRDFVVLLSIAFLAIAVDRIIGKKLPKKIRRK